MRRETLGIPVALDLAEMLDSWCRRLRRDRKSDQTQRSYRRSVEAFLTFCADTGTPPELSKANVVAWLDSQHDCGTATVRLRLTALKLFARWLAAEEGFDADPILVIAPPKLEQAPVADLSENEIGRPISRPSRR